MTLSVSDLEATARWYQDKLDFREVKIRRPDPPAHTAFWGVSQFAFEVGDLAAVEVALQAKNVPVAWAFANADLGAQYLQRTKGQGQPA